MSDGEINSKSAARCAARMLGQPDPHPPYSDPMPAMSHDHDEKDAKGERELFEAHISKLIGAGYTGRNQAGFYEWDAVAHHWKTWKAARADTASIVAEAVGDVPGHLVRIARQLEALKRPCGMDPESTTAIHNSALMGCSYALRTLSERLRARSTQPDAGEKP